MGEDKLRLFQGRPVGIPLPVKLRMVYKVIITCEPVKRATFCRRQVETKYTNPHIYTSPTYPKNKDIYTPPDRAISKVNLLLLRQALTTMDFEPSIDLEKNTEEWHIKEIEESKDDKERVSR